MDPEPSLLDYLKSLLDPRRERILIQRQGEKHAAASAGEPGARVGQPPAHPAWTSPEPPPPAEAPVWIPPEPMTPPAEAPVWIPPEPVTPPGEGSETDDRPPAAAQALPRALPWRMLLMAAFALFGQMSFEPPDRSLFPGLYFYLAAGLLGVWAVLRGELSLPALPPAVHHRDDNTVARGALWAALPLIAIAFVALGGNQFNGFNLTVWLLAILLLAWGLHEHGTRWSWAGLKQRIRPPYRFAVTPWSLLVVAAVGLVLFFRFYQLEQVPGQMFSDHAEKLQDVQDVLNGETRIFFPRNTGREFVQMYLTAFAAKTLDFGLTFMALKMGTALAGLVMLPFIYLLGVELANRRVGLLAMVLAGTSYWLNVITRVALRFSLYPLFVAPVLYFVLRGLRRGRRNDFIWAGIFLGLGLHGYSPYRFVPILVVVLVFLFLLHAGTSWKRSQAVWHLGVVVAVSFVVFLPLLRFMSEGEANRSIVLYRSLTRISTVEAEYPGDPLGIFVENMGRAMAMFAWDNGNTWVHSVVFRPALDVVSAAFFYLGYLLLIVRYFQRRSWEDAALLVSVPFLLLPSAMSLAFPNENPSLNRTGGAIIPVFLIAALMLDSVLSAVRRWAGPQWGRLAAWTAAGFLLFWSLNANYDLVFRQYREQFDQSAWNTSELGGVIRGFADSIGAVDSAWVIPWPHWVDTRLVGINAGVYIRDYAIPRESLSETVSLPGPKLFLYNLQDAETQAELLRLYPAGQVQQFESAYPGKDFMMFFAPAETQQP